MRAAETEYRRAIDLDANARGAAQGLGKLLTKQERYTEAWGVVERALCEADWPNPMERAAAAIEPGPGPGEEPR